MDSIRRSLGNIINLSRFLKSNSLFGSKMRVLNQLPDSDAVHTQNATQVAASLQCMILRLKGKYLSDDGKSVDYKGLHNDKMYEEFQSQANMLCNTHLDELNTNQKKAFFINVYNVLTIHGLCDIDKLPLSLLDISNFWKSTCYNISGNIFSLDDIEHGILRANTRHPSAIQKPFSQSDPRYPQVLPELDPRIHFALNCGGKSCPAISVYNENNLDKALTDATANFLRETVRIDGNVIHLSKLFLWYGSDFGTNDKEILRWISNYLPDERNEGITRLLDSGQFSIAHDDYNWLINAV